MSNFIEQLIALEEGTNGDAIVLMPQRNTEYYTEKYRWRMASAIVQQLPTVGGTQWVVRPLTNRLGGPHPMAGSGVYGDINFVTRVAEIYCRDYEGETEWVSVNYTDPDYPPNLLPM